MICIRDATSMSLKHEVLSGTKAVEGFVGASSDRWWEQNGS